MKAIEYFEKYKSTTDDLSMYKMLGDFSAEANDIVVNRHCQTDEAFVAVLKEQNQKWNAVVNLFEKNCGVSPIIRNGFLKYWNSKLLLKLKGVAI